MIFGLLRPGEICGLLVHDVSVPKLGGFSSACVLAIRSPKIRRSFGRHQHVVIHGRACLEWLGWLLHGVPGPLKVWPSSLSVFRATFQAVVRRADLESLRFSPAGLRAGGATHLVGLSMDLSRVQFLGRWKAHASMSIYVQEAMSALVWVQIPLPILSIMYLVLEECSVPLSIPPQVPWPALFSRRSQWRSLRPSQLRRT